MRKEKFRSFPGVIPELDLVEEADKITHNVSLDDDLETEDNLNFFKFDENFAQKEAEWDEIKKEIVGDYFEQQQAMAEAQDQQSEEDSAEITQAQQ